MVIAHGLDAHHVLLGPMSMIRFGPEGGPSQIHPSLPLKGLCIFLEELLPWGHLKLSSTQSEGLGSAAQPEKSSCTRDGRVKRAL